MTPAEQESLLHRSSPAYRAAVRGCKELPAVKNKNAVQFRAFGVSTYSSCGFSVLRATIDEGQVVEIKLPAGLAVVITDATPLHGRPVEQRKRKARPAPKGLADTQDAFDWLEAHPECSIGDAAERFNLTYAALRARLIKADADRYAGLPQAGRKRPLLKSNGGAA